MNKILLLLCFVIFSVSISFSQVKRPEAVLTDTVGEITCDHEKARLDGATTRLEEQPDAVIYFIVYGGKYYFDSVYNKKTKSYEDRKLLPRKGESLASIAFYSYYLTKARKIDAARFVLVDGGYREKHTIEYWLVPFGADEPKPSPTLTEKEIKFRKGISPKEFCRET